MGEVQPWPHGCDHGHSFGNHLSTGFPVYASAQHHWNSSDLIAVGNALVGPADRRATGNHTVGWTCDLASRRGARGSNAVGRPRSAVTGLECSWPRTDIR